MHIKNSTCYEPSWNRDIDEEIMTITFAPTGGIGASHIASTQPLSAHEAAANAVGAENVTDISLPSLEGVSAPSFVGQKYEEMPMMGTRDVSGQSALRDESALPSGEGTRNKVPARSRAELLSAALEVFDEIRLQSCMYPTLEAAGRQLAKLGPEIVPVLCAEFRMPFHHTWPRNCLITVEDIPVLACAVEKLGAAAAPLAVDLIERLPELRGAREKRGQLASYVLAKVSAIAPAVNEELRARFESKRPSTELLRFVDGMKGVDPSVLEGVSRQLFEVDWAAALQNEFIAETYYCPVLRVLGEQQFRVRGAPEALRWVANELPHGEMLSIALGAVAKQDVGIRVLQAKLSSDLQSDDLTNQVSAAIPLFKRSELVSLFSESPNLLSRCASRLHYLGACGAGVQDLLPTLQAHLESLKNFPDASAREVYETMTRNCMREIATDTGFASPTARLGALAYFGPGSNDEGTKSISYKLATPPDLIGRLQARLDEWRGPRTVTSLLGSALKLGREVEESMQVVVDQARGLISGKPSPLRPGIAVSGGGAGGEERLPAHARESLAWRPFFDFENCKIERKSDGGYVVEALASYIPLKARALLGDAVPRRALIEQAYLVWEVGSDGALSSTSDGGEGFSAQVEKERALSDLFQRLSKASRR